MKNLDELKKLLKTKSIPEIVYKEILTGKPICLNGNDDLVYELQESLSRQFNIHKKEIEIVGSAKIGISLSGDPNRLGKEYDDQSDIDLAIVSNELFDKAWRDLSIFEQSPVLIQEGDRDLIENCYRYISQGIISPNLLPKRMEFYTKWWDIFNELSKEEKFGNRNIRGRLFKDWWFTEKYYSKRLAQLSQPDVKDDEQNQ